MRGQGGRALAAIVTTIVLGLVQGIQGLEASTSPLPNAPVQVGVGMYDVTGPVAADVNHGICDDGSGWKGLHFRIRARAFIFQAKDNIVPNATAADRFAFVSVDFGMGSSVVTDKVLSLLEAEPSTKGLFDNTNVCISGTHTHSAPAGFLSHTIFQVTSLGFVHQAYEAYANGIAQAIIRANSNLQPAKVFLNVEKLRNANINRSPTAYTYNPAEERARYADEGDTDKNMTLLKIVTDDKSETPLGMLNWFSVHGTSMNNTNKLVSGDNKGLASYLFEKKINPAGILPGKGMFISAFAATNLGDVSPNINGSFCMDTGLPCEMKHSACNGRTEMCTGRGPGSDMFESTRIIAERQVEAATALWDAAEEELLGPVDMRHTFIDMTNLTFTSESGEKLSTCGAAMGYSFAAGTTDGPGMFNFIQGDNTTNPFWNLVSHILSKPTPEQVACHHPKPILLNLEGITEPYPWAAQVVPLQLVRLGRLFVISVPSNSRLWRDVACAQLLHPRCGGYSLPRTLSSSSRDLLMSMQIIPPPRKSIRRSGTKVLALRTVRTSWRLSSRKF